MFQIFSEESTVILKFWWQASTLKFGMRRLHIFNIDMSADSKPGKLWVFIPKLITYRSSFKHQSAPVSYHGITLFC